MTGPQPIEPEDTGAMLRDGENVFVQGCSGASRLLARSITGPTGSTAAVQFTGIQVPGYNRDLWLANQRCRFTTFFMTPELKAAGDAVDFLPLRYSEIQRHLRGARFDTAIFSISRPDANGLCSFGPTADFLPDLWRDIPRLIGHLNPLLPRTDGPGIPFDRLTHVVEAEETVLEAFEPRADAVSTTIANHAAAHIPDGATIQTGLGKLPGVLLYTLKNHRRLRIHSGLIGDAVLDLLDGGAIEDGRDIMTGVAIGTRRLYEALPDSGIQFRPVSHTHDLSVLAAIPDLVTINSAMQVDLLGQAYSEAGPDGWSSGPGGAKDFAAGAAAGGGLRMVILPSRAKDASRIVSPHLGRGPVSLGPSDIDLVITEQGVADLRSQGHEGRAQALIAVAHPDYREELAQSWRNGPGQY